MRRMNIFSEAGISKSNPWNWTAILLLGKHTKPPFQLPHCVLSLLISWISPWYPYYLLAIVFCAPSCGTDSWEFEKFTWVCECRQWGTLPRFCNSHSSATVSMSLIGFLWYFGITSEFSRCGPSQCNGNHSTLLKELDTKASVFQNWTWGVCIRKHHNCYPLLRAFTMPCIHNYSPAAKQELATSCISLQFT